MEADSQTAQILGQLMTLAVLTGINAFFAGAEMAVVSVNKNRIGRLAEEGNKKAVLIQKLMADSTVFLSTIQVAITLAGFFSSASAATGIAQVAADAMERRGIPWSQPIAGVAVTLILAYFNLVFGELVPKRIALQKAEAFSLFCVGPIYLVSRVMNPFIRFLTVSTRTVLRALRLHTDTLETEVSEEEIKSLLETGSETGVFNEIEKEMINSIFSFDDKRAREIMAPRQDIVAVDKNRPLSESIDYMLQSMRSRIPVYDTTIDNMIGILSVKALNIEARKGPLEQIDLQTLLTPVYFVPENRKTDVLFREMQQRGEKMAILIDEYGGVAGLVTLEDLIEEIVGEIRDEYEDEEPELSELVPHKVYRAWGGISLFDLREALHLKLESSCDTLSGYLMERLGCVPEPGQLPLLAETPEAVYEIQKIEERMIETVRITLKGSGVRNGTQEE